MTLIERTRAGFTTAYGHEPEGIAFAPGRVNLIGEHVDYNGGLVLPMPISTGTAIAWSRADGAQVHAVALDLNAARDCFRADEVKPHRPVDWRSYLRGMAQALDARGIKLAIAGSNPRGAGLSSSASLCIALGRAIHAAELGQASPEQLAQAAQLAEHDWAEVKCGIMDQMAISVGQPGEALLLDCRNLATRQVPVPGDWAVAIIQSGVTRGLVDGHYNARRQECEAAANALGVDTLRDATLEMVEAARLDPIIAARAHHVVSEIERTAQAVRALEDSDLANFGELLRQSHASLRDLFEVSVPAVDQLVALANKAIGSRGGARMTGGGFGGAVVAVVERDALPELVASVKSGFAAPDGKPLDILIEGKGSSSARNEL